jgi:iron complex transport system substrate-binding protein
MPSIRRLTPLVAALLLAVGAAACSGAGSASTQQAGSAGAAGTPSATDGAEDGATRTVQHHFGTTEVPVDAQRIVTPTQDQNALLPLLELGVVPIASAGHTLDDGTEIFRRTEGYDTSGVEWIGPYGGEVDVEAVAALRPDLIVVEEFTEQQVYDQLSRIAPTVGIRIFDRPLTEVLADFASLVGRTDRAEALHAAYEERIDALLADLGDRRESLSVSVISAGDPGQFHRADEGQALGTVMADLDLLRPAPQDGPGGDFDTFSVETLDEHDADVLLLVSYAGEDQDPGIDALTSSPTWDALAAVQAGQVHTIDGLATVGSAWGKMDTFLAELERILLADDLDEDVVVEDGAGEDA